MLTVNGMDPTIHLVHIKTVVTDDTVVGMGGEAAKCQDNLYPRRHCLKHNCCIGLSFKKHLVLSKHQIHYFWPNRASMGSILDGIFYQDIARFMTAVQIHTYHSLGLNQLLKNCP